MKKVGVVMGSDSDLPVLEDTFKTLKKFGVPFEGHVISAHRNPGKLHKWSETLIPEGFGVMIAAAGGAAHLPGVLAALTTLPVIGVPIPAGPLSGIDSLYSIVQMPSGIPVATVGAGLGGAVNAAVLAVEILAISDENLAKKLVAYKKELKEKNDEKDVAIQAKINSF